MVRVIFIFAYEFEELLFNLCGTTINHRIFDSVILYTLPGFLHFTHVYIFKKVDDRVNVV